MGYRTARPRINSRAGRTCEACQASYNATYKEQRTCSRACGVALRRTVTGTLDAEPKWPSSRVEIRECAWCAQLAAFRRGRRYCSTDCRDEAVYVQRYRRVRPERCCLNCGEAIPRSGISGSRQACGEECRRLLKRVARRRAKAVARAAGRLPGPTHRARARRYGVEYEPVASRKVFDRDGWICQLCGEDVDPELAYPDPMSASLDHTVPMSKGGPHTYGNTQLAHWWCNVLKGDALNEVTPSI